MIKVKELSKRYGDRWAIQGLNFTIDKGDVVGLLGPNGAGKSTTMKILTGYMSPTSGEAEICGYNVFESPAEVKKRIGYLPENPPLYPDMTVFKYLEYVAKLKKTPKNKVLENINYALEKTQLSEVKNRIIKNLSKGYKQRVGIAQALVSNPEVLILDEPTVGLDPKQVAEIRHLINELKGQHTVILSTHILPEVQASCNKVIIIHQGQIVAQDFIEKLDSLNQNTNVVRVVSRRAQAIESELLKIDGVTDLKKISDREYIIHFSSQSEALENAALFLIQNKLGIEELSKLSHNLEDIFLNLTYNRDENIKTDAGETQL